MVATTAAGHAFFRSTKMQATHRTHTLSLPGADRAIIAKHPLEMTEDEVVELEAFFALVMARVRRMRTEDTEK